MQGSAVRSTAGRDSGRLMLVVGVSQEGVYVCDGKERPLSRPKRKNPKHVETTGIRLSPQDTATDRALRKALREIEEQPSSRK